MGFNIFIFCYIGGIITEQVLCREFKNIQKKKNIRLTFFNNSVHILRKEYNIILLH